MNLLRVVFTLVLLALSGRANACNPPPGVDLIAGAQITVFGEYHGTKEIPAFFYDVVCGLATAAPNDAMLVALELPVTFNNTLATVGTQPAEELKRQIRADDFWSRFGDGRRSASMLQLVERLIDLGSQTRRVQIVTIEQPNIDREGAALLSRRIAEQRIDRTIILIGNAHARLKPLGHRELPFAANLLARSGQSLISLDISAGAGSAWVCAPDCASRAVLPKPGTAGIKLAPALDGAYSGVFHLPELTVADSVQEQMR
jgi:hypothetical protein